MNKKLSRLIEPNLQPYFLCLILFIAITIPIKPVLAAAEGVALVALYIYHRRQSMRRYRNVAAYIETITGGTDSITRNNLLNTPLPVVVFRADSGEVVWANQGFAALVDEDDDVLDMRIEAFFNETKRRSPWNQTSPMLIQFDMDICERLPF